MTSLALLESLSSLSIQVGLIVAVTGVVVRLGGRDVRGDLLWFCGHVAMIAVVVAAFTLPHLRLLATPPDLVDRLSHLVESQSLSATIAAIWLSGVTVSLAKLIIATSRLYVILEDSIDAPDSVSSRLEYATIGTKPICILISPKSNGPFCWQVHRPTIVLPEFILDWPTETIDSVVRHEVEHLRSRHPMHLFCQRMIECFFWFHPLVWLGSRGADCHREFHCDAVCVLTRGDAVLYLRSLLRLAETCQAPCSGLATGATFVSARSLVQQRARRIAESSHELALSSARPTSRRSFAALAFPILLSAVLATAIWIPSSPTASRRSIWSPWPSMSAEALHVLGIAVIDYEIDGHRLRQHRHH